MWPTLEPNLRDGQQGKTGSVEYMESKKGTLKALEKMKKETLDKLETLSNLAID